MNKAYLLLGSNLGNRETNFVAAKEMVESYCGKIITTSFIYETEPWGKINQPIFLNQAIEVATGMNSDELIEAVLKIEIMMGRIRNEKNGPRLIDIDILFFNEEIQKTEVLQLPHSELQNRKFALLPLAEIAPMHLHPLFKKTVAQLLKECKDEMQVKIYSPIIHS